jgi:hypothetical protein
MRFRPRGRAGAAAGMKKARGRRTEGCLVAASAAPYVVAAPERAGKLRLPRAALGS